MMALLRISQVAAVLVSLCCLSMLPATVGYSFGAAACDSGKAAVEGQHLAAPTIKTGTLAQGGLTVMLDGKALTPGTSASVTVGKSYTLTLKGTSGYKGLLFRLGGVGLGALTPPPGDPLLQVAAICNSEPASSITHTSSVIKTQSAATLKVSSAGTNLPLDVTVVFSNNAVSEYYYSAFTLNAGAAVLASPTRAPVAPTAKPVAPTAKPVAPTAKPVAPTPVPVAPTSLPVAPTAVPVTPTRAPVASVVAPVAQAPPPTAKPVAPTGSPEVPSIPTSAPTDSVFPTTLTMKPVAASPTAAPAVPIAAPSKPTSGPVFLPPGGEVPTYSPTYTPSHAPTTLVIAPSGTLPTTSPVTPTVTPVAQITPTATPVVQITPTATPVVKQPSPTGSPTYSPTTFILPSSFPPAFGPIFTPVSQPVVSPDIETEPPAGFPTLFPTFQPSMSPTRKPIKPTPTKPKPTKAVVKPPAPHYTLKFPIPQKPVKPALGGAVKPVKGPVRVFPIPQKPIARRPTPRPTPRPPSPTTRGNPVPIYYYKQGRPTSKGKAGKRG